MTKYGEMVAFIELKHETQYVEKVVTRLHTKLHFDVIISAKFTSNFQVVSDLKPEMLSKIGCIGNENIKFCRQPRFEEKMFSIFQLDKNDHFGALGHFTKYLYVKQDLCVIELCVCVCMNP